MRKADESPTSSLARAKRALQILEDIHDNIHSINLDMRTFFTFYSNGLEAIPSPYSDSLKNYKACITLPRAKELNITCCLAGVIPLVDWDWAMDYKMNVRFMSADLTSRLSELRGPHGHSYLWRWLFTDSWNNNKDWARARLELVIKHKKFYKLEDFGVNAASETDWKNIHCIDDLDKLREIGCIVEEQDIVLQYTKDD